MKFKILSLFMAFALAFGCVFGLTACKGNGIKSVEISDFGELIITMTDGTVNNLGKIKGESGKDGLDGEDGKDGTGISSAYIDEDGNLIIVLTTGEKLNCGAVANNSDAATADLFFAEKDTGYEVTGLANSSQTKIVIPSSFNNKPVISIAEEAFAGCGEIVSVTLPATVKTVGKNAFARCEGLKKVNISDVAAWCGVSFANIAANPLYLATDLYLNNVLVTELIIPDTVEEIVDFAFYGCDNIVSVDTGSGVTKIGKQAFYDCGKLESLTVGDGVEVIGEQAFSKCRALKELTLGGKLKTIDDYAFFECGSLTEISLPSSAEAIGESSFSGCSQLAELTINNGLKTIGDAAFSGCPVLKKFIMPDSVTSIGFGILMNNRNVGFVQDEEGKSNISEIRISNSLTEIPDFAFSNCKINSVIIGEKVTDINYSAFYGCEALKSVVIPQSVRKISSYAFYKCDAIEAVYYMGNAVEWQRVSIGSKGNPVKSAPVYFYSQEKPSGSGNYWHYVSGVPTPWED